MMHSSCSDKSTDLQYDLFKWGHALGLRSKIKINILLKYQKSQDARRVGSEFSCMDVKVHIIDDNTYSMRAASAGDLYTRVLKRK